MQIERFLNSIAWLTMVGLIMISGLSAQADDAEQGEGAEKKPRTEVREIRVEATRTAEVGASEEQEIVVDGETVVDERARRTLDVEEGDVLITAPNGEQRSQRILRINAEPAGDVLAIGQYVDAQDEEVGKHWIGVQINEVSPALRAQLNLEEDRGVLVGEVLPDSPASKAGIEQYDILLAIGDTKVSRNEDILNAVKAADGKEIRLTLLRGGSQRSVAVTPAERPKRQTITRVPQDRKAVANWIQNLQPGAQPSLIAELSNLQFNVVRPGQAMVLRQEWPRWPMGRQAALPEDLSVTVTREGKQPAKIKIKQKEREIETTEDKLNEIPEDVRHYVEPMLGRGRAAIGLRGGAMALPRKPESAGDVLIPAPPGQEEPRRRVRPLPPGSPQGVEGRIDELERRLDELQRAVRPPDAAKGDDTKK